MKLLFLILTFIICIGATTSATKKIYAAGSGLDMLSQPETVQEIITLSGLSTPRVLYLGTATYDDPAPMKTQTQLFVDHGCAVTALKVAVGAPSKEEIEEMFNNTDIVLVSGGNTLYAVDRWVKVGVDKMMQNAMARGVVMCGGSAGGIVWFDGGHSDSMEPASYKNPPGPLLNPAMSKEEMEAWAYIRVPGLGMLSGLFCPHYDITESNGVLRADDFTILLQNHNGEHGIGIDNWGAFMIDGDNFTVISRQGKPGSVLPNGQFSPQRLGKPGAWQMTIDQSTGALVRSLVNVTGTVSSLFTPANYIVQSKMLSVARAQNPDDGIPPVSSFAVPEY